MRSPLCCARENSNAIHLTPFSREQHNKSFKEQYKDTKFFLIYQIILKNNIF